MFEPGRPGKRPPTSSLWGVQTPPTASRSRGKRRLQTSNRATIVYVDCVSTYVSTGPDYPTKTTMPFTAMRFLQLYYVLNHKGEKRGEGRRGVAVGIDVFLDCADRRCGIQSRWPYASTSQTSKYIFPAEMESALSSDSASLFGVLRDSLVVVGISLKPGSGSEVAPDWRVAQPCLAPRALCVYVIPSFSSGPFLGWTYQRIRSVLLE